MASKEGGYVLVTPAYISSSAPVRPTYFADWSSQGAVDGACIRDAYAYLGGDTEANKEELIMEIAMPGEGAVLGFLLCVKGYDRYPQH